MRREPDVSRRGITRCHSIANLHGIAGRHGVADRHGVTSRHGVADHNGIARRHSIANRYGFARGHSSVTRTYSVAGCATRVVRSDAGRVGSTAAGATDGVRQPKRRRESSPRIRRHRDAGNRGDRLASSDGRRANGGGHRGEFRCASVLGRWRGGKRSRTGCRRAHAEPGGAYAAGRRRASDGADVGIHARWRRRDARGDAFSQ
jgi:hypothetical protein